MFRHFRFALGLAVVVLLTLAVIYGFVYVETAFLEPRFGDRLPGILSVLLLLVCCLAVAVPGIALLPRSIEEPRQGEE